MGTCDGAGELAAARARAADVPRCLLACLPTNQRPHGGAAGRARAIKKGSPTIISERLERLERCHWACAGSFKRCT